MGKINQDQFDEDIHNQMHSADKMNEFTYVRSEDPPIYHSLPKSKDVALLLSAQVDQLLKADHYVSSLIPTGFKNFDREFGGLSEGELVVIGGRPGMGKTMLMVSMALNISESSQVCFYNYDLSEQNLLGRFISALSDIPVQDIISYKRDAALDKKLFQASEKIQPLKLRMNSLISRDIEDIKSGILSEIENSSCSVFFIDNLQSLKSQSFFKRRDLELGYILTELKELAHKKKIIIVLSSQLNRSVEYRGGSKRPMLADLRDSGNIEQEADKVILMHCPDYYGYLEDENHRSLKGIMIIEMAKNRNGKLEQIYLLRVAGNTRVIDASDDFLKIDISRRRLDELDEDKPF